MQAEGTFWQHFWHWNNHTNYRSYQDHLVICIGAYTALIGLLAFVGLYWEFHVVGKFLGYASAFIQLLASMPQIITNLKARSVEGVSIIMILAWFLGDTLGVIYCALKVREGRIRINPLHSWRRVCSVFALTLSCWLSSCSMAMKRSERPSSSWKRSLSGLRRSILKIGWRPLRKHSD